MTAEGRREEVNREPPATLYGARGRHVPLSDRLALSAEEAGALLGISRDLAYDLVARGELPSVRLGRRVVVPRHALEETLAQMSRSTVDPEVGRHSAGRA
jgi:excisionase family DNA binding protein